jgi:hypothetical protein
MVKSNATYTQQTRQLVILNWNLPVGIDLDKPLENYLLPKAVSQGGYREAGLETIGQFLWYVQQGGGVGSTPANMGPKSTQYALSSILYEHQLKD